MEVYQRVYLTNRMSAAEKDEADLQTAAWKYVQDTGSE